MSEMKTWADSNMEDVLKTREGLMNKNKEVMGLQEKLKKV